MRRIAAPRRCPGRRTRRCSCSTPRPASTASRRPARFVEAAGATGRRPDEARRQREGRASCLAIYRELKLPVLFVGVGEERTT